ncbi:MAG: hypothetical protein ACKOXB_00925 [Flavobacteriales bacterium]
MIEKSLREIVGIFYFSGVGYFLKNEIYMILFRKIFSLIILTVFVLGMIVFFIGFTLQFGAGGGITNIEMPFTEVQGIIVKDDKIYVGCKDYGIIQVFSKEGVFDKSWNVNTYGKDFFFTINKNGQPVAVRTWVRYDHSVDELKQLSVNDHSDTIKQIMYPNVYTTTTGVAYTMEGETIKKLIESKNGKDRVVIEQGLIMGFLANPKKPAGVALVSMLLLVLLNLRIFKIHFRWSDSSSFWEAIRQILKKDSQISPTK